MSQNKSNSMKQPKRAGTNLTVVDGEAKAKKPKPKTKGAKSAKSAAGKAKGAKSAKPAAGKAKGTKSAKPAGQRARSAVNRKNTKIADTSDRKPKSVKDAEREDFENRSEKRDAERARRREERQRKVRRQKITIAALSGVIVVAAAVLILFMTPSLKLSRSLAKGDRYAQKEEYESAQESYENALEIDPASVQAYRGMADTYLAQGKVTETEQILYDGWEQTQDEGLLHYYCVEVYNEAVGEINADACTLATADKCVQVLELEPDNQDALETLGTHVYGKLFDATQENDTCMLFFDEDVTQDTCSYGEYEQLVRRLLTLYQDNKTDGLKSVLRRYALIDMPYVRLSLPHVEQYTALLTDINGTLNDADIAETLACLERAKEVEDYFAQAFTEFEAGNYAYARELVSGGSYQKIRDDFINENSGYWEGAVYIPVNREQLVLHREEGGVRFSFLGQEDYHCKYGVITVWGTKQEDDGIQRSAISYVPVGEDGNMDTEYTIQYLYSNVKINGKYVPQMNFRFDTKVTTEEGITTNAIGDWGGEHEWEIDY